MLWRCDEIYVLAFWVFFGKRRLERRMPEDQFLPSNFAEAEFGQFAWAFAMERRGRGELARRAPRLAGLETTADPFATDNAVNEAQIC